jgi:hypothetical protein
MDIEQAGITSGREINSLHRNGEKNENYNAREMRKKSVGAIK